MTRLTDYPDPPTEPTAPVVTDAEIVAELWTHEALTGLTLYELGTTLVKRYPRLIAPEMAIHGLLCKTLNSGAFDAAYDEFLLELVRAHRPKEVEAIEERVRARKVDG